MDYTRMKRLKYRKHKENKNEPNLNLKSPFYNAYE